MSGEYVLSVTQLNEYAANLLRRDFLLKNVAVCGEVSGLKKHSSGHIYFSVKDENALVRCVMFKQDALSGLKCSIADGMFVTVRGYVTIYTRDGQFQINASSVEGAGNGELYERFLMLKSGLEKEGLFDREHKKPLPFLPNCIGVVTSETGAVIRDIRSVTQRRFPNMPIILAPAKVQGDGAAKEIVEGIKKLDGMEEIDVIIVGRGGGSMEDLWTFNDESVARAIFECKTPIVSAVGHETDFTIADFIADLRAPTPSAAAELCVPLYDGLTERIEQQTEMLERYCAAKLKSCEAEIRTLVGGVGQAVYSIDREKQRASYAVDELKRAAQTKLDREKAAFERLIAEYNALNPFGVLKRGYSIVRHNGMCVTDALELKENDRIDIIMANGGLEAVVAEVKRGGTNAEEADV